MKDLHAGPEDSTDTVSKEKYGGQRVWDASVRVSFQEQSRQLLFLVGS